MKNILLTFTGFHDPYTKGLVGQEDQPGPILALVAARPFDHIVLFSTPSTEQLTIDTQTEIKKRAKDVQVDIRNCSLNDPTDYTAILRSLRRHIREIVDEQPDAHYSIAVASGTPHMHACWVLLAASGEIPAKILHIRPPRFVTKECPLVSEVDLSADEFPAVRAKIAAVDTSPDMPPDFDVAVRQLGIIGDHESMRTVLEVVATLAPSNAAILIRGETGTGKELLARLVHQLSGRPADLFVPINCAAIPEELVESILFGHKRGAFTGANADQMGKFDLADGGTLFLDELAELPTQMQAKLLRVLEDGLVEPIGDKAAHKVDVRIVAATNRDIGKAIKQSKFREDLYYRLNIGEVVVPPLRERRSDIPKLALHVLDRVNATMKRARRLSQAALARLQSQAWPGNVRDLENVIERSVRLSRNEVLEADDLLISEPVTHVDPLDALPEPQPGFSLEGFIGSARKQLILKALEAAEGNQSEAARLLGVSPQAVSKFLKQLDDYNRS
ncbi:MAG: sigma-54-dependent Fis family transcriptional regulator [Candidatus Abyssobacteria bacterium SURF_17]|uniref:Sigma-54-dependent Fis family transcriptional regulator n=1 Tax=Candidatus Abyssobacteria bacterium SURF_17 TaxID=2093361 RepID=A0A419ERA2_9BACT|nr:MAG: sigma-54-dependent Fis family transcriptional regulator [Candidatus Abyssubacteria bacterium SURF_17]